MPKKNPLEVITLEAYEAGWKAYRSTPTQAAVRRATGWRTDTAKRVIERGVPKTNLPAYESRMKAIAALTIQMDTDEAARSIAAGRGFLRRGISIIGRRLSQVDDEALAKMSLKDALTTMPKLVELNEQLSRIPIEADAAVSMLEKAANLQEATSGLLGEVAKLARLSIPMTPTNGKANGNGKTNGNGNGKDPLEGLTPEEIRSITQED